MPRRPSRPYDLVPKGQVENLRYRYDLYAAARESSQLREWIFAACKEDPLFFFNAFCIEKSTSVLTRFGVKRIDLVENGDEVWDGDNWVKCGGAVSRGNKVTIKAYGIRCTPDHEIWTKEGWQRADKGIERAPVGIPMEYLGWRPDRPALSEKRIKKRPVYDILNCGPKQAFTIINESGEPVLVHNCWLYEPRERAGQDKVFPFTTWEHQDPVIDEIHKHLGHDDVVVSKARAEGMSWIAVMLCMKFWLFNPGSAVGLVSKTEADADNPRNPDSLFWKIDKHLEWLPPWMAGRKNRHWVRSYKDHALINRRNESVIRAYSCTGDVASGGRSLFMVMDELAKFKRGADQDAMTSTQQVTESRLVISTPKGADGAYYELVHGHSNIKPIVLDWKDNPYRNRGLYSFRKGKPVATDPHNNPLRPDYDPPTPEIEDMFNRLRLKGFVLEDTVRSPWYDRECDRAAATPQTIAQELDRSFGGSMFQIFGKEFFDRCDDTVRPADRRGILDVREDTLELRWDEARDGPARMWCPLDANDQPPPSRYVMGCDISSGLAGDFTSNSVIQVLDRRTCEQVFEYAVNYMPPRDFADVAVAIAKWFNNAFLAWEQNGPGAAFAAQVISRGYSNVYQRRVKWKRRKHSKVMEVGWYTNKDSKEVMFSDMNVMIRSGEYTVRSKDLLDEFNQYVREKGDIKYNKRVSELEDTQTHGDRVMAFGVAIQAAKERPVDREAPDEEHGKSIETAPSNSMAGRLREWEEDARREKEREEWDDRESAELIKPPRRQHDFAW